MIENLFNNLWGSLVGLVAGVNFSGWFQGVLALQAGLDGNAILDFMVQAAMLGLLPGVVAGAVALPLFGSSDLLFKFAIGGGLGGFGAMLYKGISVSDALQRPVQFISLDPASAGSTLAQILYAGLVGLFVGGLIVVVIYETVRTLYGALFGALVGVLAAMGLNLIQAQGFALDGRVINLIIGGFVFAVTAFFLSGTE